MKSIVILGAGISGLALGWYLKKIYSSSIEITILETNSRTGGWIQTIKKENFLFELGPRSCRTSGTGLHTLQLIEELGLEEQVITANPAAKKRFLYINNQLTPLPNTLFQCLSSPLMKRFPQAIFKDLWKEKSFQEESIHDFFSRRFHPEIAENFADPLTSGIYAGDTKKLSLKSCFPTLYQWEQEYGSIIKGLFYSLYKSKIPSSPFVSKISKKGLFSFKNGMETLPKVLSEKLAHQLRLNCGPYTLRFQTDHIDIQFENGKILKADHLISAIPASQLSLLINQSFEALSATSIAVVSLGYHRKVLNNQGFGYLIPSKEKESILGVVWDSCVFPEQNQHEDETRLTVMIGGSHLLDFTNYTSEDFLRFALEAIEKQLNIKELPIISEVTITKNALPQYLIGHSAMIAKKQNFHPHFTMLGNSFYGVSVNDCIYQAKITSSLIAKKILPI